MTREEAVEVLKERYLTCVGIGLDNHAKRVNEAIDMAISALSAEPIERISENTIVVKYADYEDIGRIILTNGDIFCKMFYEDARQNDDSDYDSLVPDEYKTEPSDYACWLESIIVTDEPCWLCEDSIDDEWCHKNCGTKTSIQAECLRHFFKVLSAESHDIRTETHECVKETHDSDLISRADAIEAVCREICDTSRDKCETMADGNCGIIQRIDSLPSADAVQGEWIKNDDFTCSECGYHMIVGDGAYNFCPNCGARMKGGDEE